MRLFILLALISVLNLDAQQPEKKSDYESSWGNVNDFLKKGQPKSALRIVNDIYSRSKREKNASQQVKAIIYRIKLTEETEEQSDVKTIAMLENEAKESAFPVKPVLQSMLAEKYWNYYRYNRYRFQTRTETQNFENTDISTWSVEKIVDEVIRNYRLSLSDAANLKKINISFYNDILVQGNAKGREFRPSLYDFLAHRALDVFMNDEPDIIRPSHIFTLNSEDYFRDAEDFSNLVITSSDSLSYKYYALKIFQDLIRFHLTDSKPGALMDVELKRLQFVYHHSTVPENDQLYMDALRNLEKKTAGSPVSAYASLEIARLMRNLGNKYNPLVSGENKWDVQKAYQIYEAVIQKYPGSDGAAMAFNLQQEIKQKTLTAVTERVNVPDTPFRTLVTYRNIKDLFWKAIPVKRNEISALRQKWIRNYKEEDPEKKFLEIFLNKTPVRNGKVVLPDDSDFQQHSAEIKIDGLPAGEYMIVLSADENFSLLNNALNYVFTTISNLSYIHRNLNDGRTEFYVLDRSNGEPLASVKAQIFFNVYNSKKRSYEGVPGDIFTSGPDGRFVVPYQFQKLDDDSYYHNFYVNFSLNNDSISTMPVDPGGYRYDGLVSQTRAQKKLPGSQTLFFLDRAIYRPGQTIYFKGLLYLRNDNKPEILPFNHQKVRFYDANGQEIGMQKVVTNEYGTFSGTFTAPTSGLTGEMSIGIDDVANSRVYFSVEEYKRPKFEVLMDTVDGIYRLKEKIHATGRAKAYSGANIDGAKVAYRVVREARFPWWWWSWYEPSVSSPQMEISNGTATTDSEGKFSIDFLAIPDESIDRKSDPVFIYNIYADVTDINGETHNGFTSVSVGYRSVSLGVDIKDFDISKDTVKQYPIRSTNLSGKFQPLTGTIRIWKLKNPQKPFRERFWQQPDTFTMTRKEYYKNFPFDLYDDELNPLKWNREKEVLSTNFNTAVSKKLFIPDMSQWKSGKYRLEISSADPFGEDVTEFVLFDVSEAEKLSYPEMFHFKDVKMTAEPGETALIEAGSSENVSALFEVEQDGNILEKSRIELNGGKRLLEIPVKEEYRGNAAVHFTFVCNNRLYTRTSTIIVPYTNKELSIRFETFRDKLQPGRQEQWKIKISGKKAEKVTAEMVATLYDASLDAFRPHFWHVDLFRPYYSRLRWNSTHGFDQEQFMHFLKGWNDSKPHKYNEPLYDRLRWNFPVNNSSDETKGADEGNALFLMAEAPETRAELKSMKLEESVVLAYDKSINTDTSKGSPEKLETSKKQEQPAIRKNFNETAFFYPHLQTNENGEIIINFTIPDALTRWKMLGFAHTKELQNGMVTKELVTQKDLMIVPNQPRFFRENDKMYFSAKVTSLADHDLSGEATLEFFDALTMKPVNDLIKTEKTKKSFEVKAGQSTGLEWKIEIPEGIQAITYRITATAGEFSDGEEMTLPVVTNRMLVTETLPLPIRGKQTKEFKFEKLLNNTSPTLRNQRFTLEFTSNPAWYAVQALPYLMEYPFECTEQLFSRFYANSLATHIANSNPKIKRVFDTWSKIQPDALLSNLEKNQELKSALLEETPWVLNAKDESQRKRNIALLFDLNRMANEQADALKKIRENQQGNGGFPWFKGMPENRFITQHIIAGMGHLDVLGIKQIRTDNQTWYMVQEAVRYADSEILDSYEQLLSESKKGRLKMSDNHLGYFDIHYLYARSYFKDLEMDAEHKTAFGYFLGQAKKYWIDQNIYAQGMIALALHRYGENDIPSAIIASLNERALHSDEMGMYWKSDRGYYWYQAPIETQALMIELYDDVAKDSTAVEDLKVWLLKQKQTQDWRTTKATTEACYALLRRGTDVLSGEEIPEIKVGNIKVDPTKQEDTKIEAGTGYFKTAWTASEIKPEMGNIRITKKDAGVAWGAAYWQYFEQLDKITTAETPLSIKKQLFLQENTDRGPVLKPIDGNTQLHVGDLVKVRIEIRADRTMEYIHLKDMRAAGFEPEETLSTFKYQDGLWYYQSTRDLATNFFIGWLPKGTYVFEYPLRVSQKGDFSNGVTTIQSMYAPEFSSHSEGIRVRVD